MLTAEQSTPSVENIETIQDVIDQLDVCFLYGFVGGQYDILNALPQIFAGSPLESRIQASIQALTHNEFLESHFLTLAAVRCALQGALYDTLLDSLRVSLGRAASSPAEMPEPPAQTDPLLDSARHWLMELALSGFARLEPGVVLS